MQLILNSQKMFNKANTTQTSGISQKHNTVSIILITQ